MTPLFAAEANPVAPDGLVTVGRFEDPTEAQMARGMLEAAGVACFLVGENANHMIAAAFRVWVQVSVEDESVARELLAGTGEEAADPGVDEGVE